jgi:SAM-dependent methyltransferase
MGFGTGRLGAVGDEYELKPSQDSSHAMIERRLGCEPPSKILDLGCSGGALARRLRDRGHHVTGVDSMRVGDVDEQVSQFFLGDLERGIPDEVGSSFDIVIAADLLEHLRDPDRLLRDVRRRLRPGGMLLASVPNFGHWYPRFRVAVGRFDYDQRGILDRTHLRFFSRQSFRRLARASGFLVVNVRSTGLPVDVLGLASPVGRVVAKADHLAVSTYPNLFAYQFLFELEPTT